MNDSILIVGACFIYLAAACFAIIALGIVFASRWANGTVSRRNELVNGHERSGTSQSPIDKSE